jgi:hypothetical protein
MGLARLIDRIAKRRRLNRASRAALPRLDKLQCQQALLQWRAACLPRNPLLAYGAKHYSQNDEDGLIAEIVRRLGLPLPAVFVELGVGDGTENNTLNLLAQGWRGAWLGGQPLRLHTEGSRLRFDQVWIDGDNVARLVHAQLQAMGSEQPTLLSIDLDGNDWHLCRTLLAQGLRPPVWVLEYNARFDAATHWVMPYDAQHRWQRDDHYGASLRAFVELMQPAGYRLVCCNLTGANAFFVAAPYLGAFADVPAEWQSLYMPALQLPYPWFGHPASLRTLQQLIAAGPDGT